MNHFNHLKSMVKIHLKLRMKLKRSLKIKKTNPLKTRIRRTRKKRRL